MWIERLEFAGFGNLIDRKIEFSKDKLNLVLEGNEYGKSTIGEAIWAVLFDFPARTKTTADKLKDREIRQPSSGGLFKCCLDLTCKDKSLRIVRDFAARTIRVFDRSNADLEITSDFLSGANSDDLGFKLTGMSRDLFKNTCFVGQRDLDSNSLSELEDLSSLLQSLADASGCATTSATAVSVLEGALAQFPYKGYKMRADRLLSQLEQQANDLKNLLKDLILEKENAGKEMAGLAEIEQQLVVHDKQGKASLYLRLCLEVAETDNRLVKAQDKLQHVNDLKAELAALKPYGNFPEQSMPLVEQLWTNRQSRLDDCRRTEIELKLQDKLMQARQRELCEKWQAVLNLNRQDAQQLAALSGTLLQVEGELADSMRKREKEMYRVKEAGVNLDHLSGIRAALLNLDARDMDNAGAYNAMICSEREQSRQYEGSVWRACQILPEIEEQRKIRLNSCRNNFIALAMFILVVATFIGAMGAYRHEPLNSHLIWSGFVVLFALAIAIVINSMMWMQARSHRRKDADQARSDEQKYRQLGSELQSKMMGLEIKLDGLARKAGIASGAELMKYIETYSTAAAQLKDLDLLDQLIDSRKSHATNLVAQIEPYFFKAGSHEKITGSAASALAQEINSCLDEEQAVKGAASSLEHHAEQLKFLSEQLSQINGKLKEHFVAAQIEHADDAEFGYREFMIAAAGFKKWQSAGQELLHMEQDANTDLPVAGLAAAIEKLEGQREALGSQVEELVLKFPEIASVPPPGLTASWTDKEAATNIEAQSAQCRQDAGAPDVARDTEIEALAARREELTVRVRAQTYNYDEKYLKTTEELEEVEAMIDQVKRAKTALELARDTFVRLGQETHMHWSSRLNEISREMLKSLNTEFDSLNFGADLRLTARRKGESEPLQAANINSQSSTGTREQLHWLSRMAVARYLAEQTACPIILDEPFSESDDERFLSTMRFLLDNMLGKHQLILFSCHGRRHQWLLDQLTEKQRCLIRQCRLTPLGALSDAPH